MISSFMLAYITSNKIIHQCTRFLSNNAGGISRWLKRLRKLKKKIKGTVGWEVISNQVLLAL